MNNDKKTTVLGVAAGAVIAAQVDWSRLLAGDLAEIGKAVGAVIACLLGYFTNKPK